jgi:hypothetical protein
LCAFLFHLCESLPEQTVLVRPEQRGFSAAPLRKGKRSTAFSGTTTYTSKYFCYMLYRLYFLRFRMNSEADVTRRIAPRTSSVCEAARGAIEKHLLSCV